jgi:hypothetical protein
VKKHFVCCKDCSIVCQSSLDSVAQLKIAGAPMIQNEKDLVIRYLEYGRGMWSRERFQIAAERGCIQYKRSRRKLAAPRSYSATCSQIAPCLRYNGTCASFQAWETEGVEWLDAFHISYGTIRPPVTPSCVFSSTCDFEDDSITVITVPASTWMSNPLLVLYKCLYSS